MTDHGNSVGSRGSTPNTSTGTPDTSPPSAPTPPDNKKIPDGLAEPCRPKPPTSNCLDKRYLKINDLCFQNMADAVASMNHIQWRAPANDASIPHSDERYRQVVKQLVSAFKDMTTAKDTPDNAYRKRLTPHEKTYYSDWAIENCAWNILRMVKDIHTYGFNVPIYDRTILDQIGQTQLWTFQERIDWICLVLRTSKHVAVTLMKHEKIWTTLGAPHRLYGSTLVNSVSNGHRNIWVKAGREADEGHQARPKRRRIDNNAATDTTNTVNDSLDMTNTTGTTVNAIKSRKGMKYQKHTQVPPATPVPTTTTAVASASASTPIVKQPDTDVEMIDAVSDQLAKNGITEKHEDVVSKDKDRIISTRKGNIKVKQEVEDNEGNLLEVSNTSKQANNTADPNVNHMNLRTNSELEAARTLAALCKPHVAKQ